MGQRRRALTPERSALHLWGAELRAWRDRRGLSLAGLRDIVRYDASYLARLERAEQFPPQPVAEACDRALATGGELIRLWHLAELERRHASNHVANGAAHVANPDLDLGGLGAVQAPSDGEGVVVPCRTLEGRIIWVSVPRRTFLLGGVGAVATAAARGPGRVSGVISRGRCASPGLEDVSPVEHLRKLRAVLVDSDNLLGARHVITTVEDYIQVIRQLREQRTGADRRALLHVQAEYAEFAGWLHQDVGYFGLAQHWLDRALEWSHAVDDWEMATYVLARKSQLAGDMNDASSAIDLADAAAGLARPRSRLLATAATYRAHGYALADERTHCLRGLDNAFGLAEDPDDDPKSPWAPWLDNAYIDAQRARCLSIMGDHGTATDVYQQAIRGLPSTFRRDRGVYLAREALAHASNQDPEQAAAVGKQALVIADETQSGRIVNELAHLDGKFAR